MTIWTNHKAVGYLPIIFLEHDPRTIQEQAHERYTHGGGWMSFEGFVLVVCAANGSLGLQYPGDSTMHELARAQFRDQYLVLFEGSWVGIIEADGTLSDVSRMD